MKSALSENIGTCHRCHFKTADGKRCSPDRPQQRKLYDMAKLGSCPLQQFESQGGIVGDAAMWRAMMIEAAHTTPDYLGGTGSGIVMCGGGIYFDAAYVSIRVIRMLGCTLPIELWHLGPMEMLPWQRAAVEPLNVIVRDAFDIDGEKPAGGWQLKPFAVVHSAFEKVLSLDADCYPVDNPVRWFSQPWPSVFWPDQQQFEVADSVFDVVGVKKRGSRPFESGQFFVDRRECWKELSLTWWMNRNSDYYYRLWKGDKETFRMAWLFHETPIVMSPREYAVDLPAIIGFGFDNQPAFVHRCCGKLTLNNTTVFTTNSSPSKRNDRLPHEAEVWKFLEELRVIRGEQVSAARKGCCGP